ncbi:MAG: sn-glycerol-3-phosphate ABC transporter ATP-binding protein UgpC [Verrucomicrobia bacterium]|nr:sn-glycerol-3-phosphate ABC transporter ATP-binding protein UgpC [Verrucomicrobiota bacterium]
MSAVELKDVTKVFYGEKGAPISALNKINLDVRQGELMVLVGPSGCGKSTLLRMIAGLETVTEGLIEIEGRVVNRIPPKDRDVAMVFQNFALFPYMTVFENMAFGLKFRKIPKREIQRRVGAAAEILHVSELMDRKPKELSGGQRQRVAVGRAIVCEPKVFLFDEPLSNLDAKMRTQMRAEIARIHSQLRATMIFVTHDQTEAMTLGERICVLDKGIVMQVGKPMELYRNPKNKFVADFIGNPGMNFLKGRIDRIEDRYIFVPADVECPGNSIPIVVKYLETREHFPKENVELGVRPEDIGVFDAADAANEPATLPATVEYCEPLGHETLIYLRVGSSLLTARRPSDQGELPAGSVRIRIDLDRIQFFDPRTQQSIQ